MTDKERQAASKDQIERFFSSYFSHWRLARILLNEKILAEKYAQLNGIAEFIMNEGDDIEGVIAQEMTSGLEFDTLSHCVQYIEDLFALLNAGKRKEYFVKSVTSYDAGAIKTFINRKFSDKELCELFYFPYFEQFDNTENDKVYKQGLAELRQRVEKLRLFYEQYHFFYEQYKHGLTVALRPFGNYSPEQILDDKHGKGKSYLAAFDSLSVRKASKKKGRYPDYMLMPCFTENVQKHIKTLEAEDNLLRFVVAPPNTSVTSMKECAILTRQCMHLFIHNLLASLTEDVGQKLRLPADNEMVHVFDFSSMPIID